MNFQFAWSTEWIQKYESPWGIIEKFKYANAINGNIVLKLIGNEKVRNFKEISNAGRHHRDLIYFHGVDCKLSRKILGINLKQYHDYLLNKSLYPFAINKSNINYNFHWHLNYCPTCLSTGYHSIFHQIKFFDHCLFHPLQNLISTCPKCKRPMPEYSINKENIDAYNCICGHIFLSSKNIRGIFSSWKKELIVQSNLVNTWQALPKHIINMYHLSYPFYNYKNNSKFDKKNTTQHLKEIPQLLISAFTENKIDNSPVMNIYSNENIFQIKDNYHRLSESYNQIFPYRTRNLKLKEKCHTESIFFEIYKQTRVIYKSISRYIQNKIINIHKKCVRNFDDTYQDDPICLHAYAFILWKSECEGRRIYPRVLNQAQVPSLYDFRFSNNQFSIFPKGPFMIHLKEILNSFQQEPASNGDWGFNLLKYNLSAINYVVNRITSYLLIERYISWLEVIHHPKEFKFLYPNGDIPMYLTKIPLEKNESISFYFPSGRFNYMKSLVMDIDKKLTCYP
ncbi:hypothetical protein RW25_06175 [Bacillus sp. L_1B0_8]|uniref:hypothetical protein n=1 Tax=unclassified Bacillus (in: firmicutes) TaxID=185979 RepID=UPI0005B6B69C|nr:MULTISPECIES: hypothetical protein [unclassified Bacillus (in: firmicutes)]KIQ81411.1 hypothetical protein RT27_25475 [Bacillus sp. L_1B0_5]KIQ91201.1 hypothetical protein RW25_06175 [Bacillus sp. L_1B0_8]